MLWRAVDVVVDLPVGLPDLPRRVEQALQAVLQDPIGPQRDATALDGLGHSVDDVRALLENVRPHKVEQMDQRVLATQASNTQRLCNTRVCSAHSSSAQKRAQSSVDMGAEGCTALELERTKCLTAAAAVCLCTRSRSINASSRRGVIA